MSDEHKDDHPMIGDGVPEVENDPEVLAEERRLRIRILRLHYYREIAGTIKVFLQAFKTEAASLVSGVGTLVLGYYQVKKWVLHERRPRSPMTGEGLKLNETSRLNLGLGRVWPTAVPTQVVESRALSVDIKPFFDEQSFSSDPMFYLLVACVLAFSVSSFKIAVSKIRGLWKPRGSSGGSDGSV